MIKINSNINKKKLNKYLEKIIYKKLLECYYEIENSNSYDNKFILMKKYSEKIHKKIKKYFKFDIIIEIYPKSEYEFSLLSLIIYKKNESLNYNYGFAKNIKNLFYEITYGNFNLYKNLNKL